MNKQSSSVLLITSENLTIFKYKQANFIYKHIDFNANVEVYNNITSAQKKDDTSFLSGTILSGCKAPAIACRSLFATVSTWGSVNILT